MVLDGDLNVDLSRNRMHINLLNDLLFMQECEFGNTTSM